MAGCTESYIDGWIDGYRERYGDGDGDCDCDGDGGGDSDGDGGGDGDDYADSLCHKLNNFVMCLAPSRAERCRCSPPASQIG